MMAQAKALNVAIVGGGPGCRAVMDMILAEKLSQLQMRLIGVACTDPNAVGYRYAQDTGVYVTQDYRDLFKLQDLHMIIELTGREEVPNEISRVKPDHVRLMDHVAARLFWDIFQLEEQWIAEREQAEEALKHSEQEYSVLVENSLTGIYIDQDGKVVFCNNRFAQIYGYLREELIGTESCQLVHPKDRVLTDEIRAKRIRGENPPSEYEARGVARDGRTMWIIRRNTLIDYKGRPAILGNVVDITERKRAQKAFLETQERYYTVLEAFPDPVVVYDAEGKGVYINPAFSSVFGWAPGEVLGMKMDYVPDENWPETHMMIEKVLAGESVHGLETRRYTKDRRIIDVSISAASYLSSEEVSVGSVSILRDITDRKRVDEALRRARDGLEQRVEERTAELASATERLKLELAERRRTEEELRLAHRDLAEKATALEAANEELSQYAYVVSHDLKAPLRAIRNYSDFLCEDLEALLEEDHKTCLHGLERAVRQGEELVEDLLEFSRVGRLSRPTEKVDMGLFLQELTGSLDLSPDVEVVTANDWPTFDVDPTLLRQVFQDLIKNATKFNHSPRKRVEIGWQPVGNKLHEVFVRDNGIGIDPRYHEQIFGVFQRLHTRKEYEGTGLGLAIVKKAAGKLDGSVRVESKAGEGSTFYIALPKTQNER